MSEQPVHKPAVDEPAAVGPENTDVDIDAAADPDLLIDDEMYEDTPDDLGGTGGPDAGGAG